MTKQKTRSSVSNESLSRRKTEVNTKKHNNNTENNDDAHSNGHNQLSKLHLFFSTLKHHLITPTTSQQITENNNDHRNICDSNKHGFFKSTKLKFALFVESLFPTKYQLSEKRLQNRMKMCILAVCLMWASSLKVAVYIATHAVHVPSIHMMYGSCKAAVKVVLDERRKYATCVDTQLDQCQTDLDRSIATEISRINVSSTLNTVLVSDVEATFNACISDYTAVRFSLQAWVDVGQSIPMDNNTCSRQEQDEVLGVVGDINLLRAETISLTNKYGHDSESTVRRMATYTKARMTYDRNYLNTHTSQSRKIVQSYLTKLAAEFPDISLNFDKVYGDLLDQTLAVIPCVSPVKNVNCSIGVSAMYDLIADAITAWKEMINKYEDGWVDTKTKYYRYYDNAMRAYDVAAAFFDRKFTIHL